MSAYVALAVLGLVIMGCLVSMMVVFMGGPQGASDFRSLLSLQLTAIPLALLAALTSIIVVGSKEGVRSGLKSLWRALPQWLVIAFVVLNSLFVFGEVSLIIVAQATDVTVPWFEHVPLICMLACSIAFLVVYAHARLGQTREPALSGRWP
ncbi:MAG: hypothetical protein AAFX56_09410 [Pseudomonadota bacterium]